MAQQKRKTKVKIAPFEDKGGEWRWRMRLGNNLKFATSGEAFANKGNARRAARRLAELIPGAVVEDE